ncbi:MAG: hypothetical protein O3A87_11520, partial [Verrucomicrobia bacterium]|nr:hypothetical protein [Verrucomicrobiota bacterium]
MKKRTKSILFILPVIVGLLSAGITQAAPPGKGIPGGRGRVYKAATEESMKGLEKGDQFAVICNECGTMTIKTVGDPKEVAALCHEGGKIHCDSCEADRVAKKVGPPGKQHTIFVDEHGKNCMMIV